MSVSFTTALHVEEIVDGIHLYDMHVFLIDGDELPYLKSRYFKVCIFGIGVLHPNDGGRFNISTSLNTC